MTETLSVSSSPPAENPKEKVSITDVLAELPELSEKGKTPSISITSLTEGLLAPHPPTFQQWHGARLANRVLWFICGLAFVFLGAWWFTRPSIAEVKDLLGSSVNGKELLEALRNLRTDHFNAFRDLFQLVVMSGLVPLFTLLAGYAFGARQAEKQE
jgi:hypothetical protein